MPTVRSFCRVCTSVCGILVDIDGDRVVAVHGDGEHPFSHGYTCPKGRALPQLHHHPDRLERPQMRMDGTLQNTTWEACLDDLGTKLRETGWVTSRVRPPWARRASLDTTRSCPAPTVFANRRTVNRSDSTALATNSSCARLAIP